ncbi:E3 binding domain-containing protein [Metapseudomonas resinovorans]|uniref:E3 binding domain-containing protein n=1 Tax=Metapseudomonas resinovorans TaxID=53412 RepID=UPI0003FDC18A|nr:E3 binding domain-containing protein [Pseudomonas resinovorans]
MSVQVIDVKTGQLKSMSERYARILVKMKRARWPDQEGQSIAPEVILPPSSGLVRQVEVKVSKAAKALAESAGIDLNKVAGTGTDGAITKPDVEAFIVAQQPQE